MPIETMYCCKGCGHLYSELVTACDCHGRNEPLDFTQYHAIPAKTLAEWRDRLAQDSGPGAASLHDELTTILGGR